MMVMVEFFLLFAQLGGTDPITNGSGWVGAGLLGLVLGWLLLQHLPAKDKQIKDLMEAKDQQIKDLVEVNENRVAQVTAEQRTDFGELIKQLRIDSQTTMNLILQHNAQINNEFRNGILAALERHGEHLDRLRELIEPMVRIIESERSLRGKTP